MKTWLLIFPVGLLQICNASIAGTATTEDYRTLIETAYKSSHSVPSSYTNWRVVTATVTGVTAMNEVEKKTVIPFITCHYQADLKKSEVMMGIARYVPFSGKIELNDIPGIVAVDNPQLAILLCDRTK